MQTTKVKQGQTFFDTIIETTGDITNVFEFALLNDVSVTNDVVTGQNILIPETIKISSIKFKKGHYPASKDIETVNESSLDYLLPQTLPHI
ncbi:MAG TPA: hypothetical protein VLY87_07775 [Flavobacterium sp.]|nr:hypothetical protein [Flavobacterium sp.]